MAVHERALWAALRGAARAACGTAHQWTSTSMRNLRPLLVQNQASPARGPPGRAREEDTSEGRGEGCRASSPGTHRYFAPVSRRMWSCDVSSGAPVGSPDRISVLVSSGAGEVELGWLLERPKIFPARNVRRFGPFSNVSTRSAICKLIPESFMLRCNIYGKWLQLTRLLTVASI